MGYYLVGVLILPLLLWVAWLGCGLALERLLGVRVHNAVLLPLGLCVSLVLILPGYTAGAGDWLALTLLIAVALAGLLVARDGLRARLNPGWAGAAGIATYLLFLLPVIAYGRWSWSGYDFVNDSAFEMLIAEHLKGFGAVLGNIPETSEREFLNQYFGNGYPMGSQALLATMSGLTRTSAAVLYQGYISALAAVAAVALTTVTRGLLTARRAAALAVIALAANLTYQYALQGGIKEIALLATVCALVALTREALLLERPYPGAVLVALGAAAALAAYNAVAVPFIGALALFGAGAFLLVHPRRPKPGWALPVFAGVALVALLAIPELKTLETFLNFAKASQASSGVGATQFGQLLRPLPLSQLSGVWLAGEYRLPVTPEPAALLTAIATVATFVLLVPALLWSLYRRQPGLLLLFGTFALVVLVVRPRVSPYAQGKVLAIAGPAIVLTALAAPAALRGRLAPLGAVVAGALGVAVIASDLLAYSYDHVAPTPRMEAIRQVGDRFRGQGLVLWNEFEEYAKYFARAARISVPFEALTPQQVKLRNPTFFYGHYFDLDEELLSFVEQYPIIVTRRSPAASRPPANYQLVYENSYYRAWRRRQHPQVLGHLPLQQLYSPEGTIACGDMRSLVARAPRGSRLVVAHAPEMAWFEPISSTDRSPGWTPDAVQPGAVETRTAGHATGVLTVKGGRYLVWIQGTFPRSIAVSVDGRTAGSVSELDTPLQWRGVASLSLAPGQHVLRLVESAGRRHLGPGQFAIGTVGAGALQADTPERLQTLATARWRSLCGTSADWVELVRP